MIKSDAERLTKCVAAFGLLISLGSVLMAGPYAGLSAAAGAALALLNLLVLRTLVLRVMEGEIHRKMSLLFLIFLKMGAFLTLVSLAIARHWVEPIAFTVGLSSLVVGLITGSLVVTRFGSRSEY
jgi:hypothetical protein